MSWLNSLKWNYLSGTARELDNVSNFFSENKTMILRGNDASEFNLKTLDKQGNLSKYKYLLFATHGLYVPEKPELSSILLRPDDKPINGRYENDGYITVGEWMSYHLNSDLVYLSACESGLGRFRAGEGIVGIPYGLCVAGNQNTVMSLWNIGDRSTTKFTSSFFEKFSQGESAKKALSKTKREFISNKNYNDPSIWSTFLLYGY